MNGNKKLKRKIFLGFFAAFIILLFIGTLSYKSLLDLNEINSRIQANYLITGKIEDVFMDVQTTISSQGAYVYMDEPGYLESYIVGKEEIASGIQDLKEVIKDDKEKLQKITELENLIAKRVRVADSAVSIYNAHGKDSAINYLRTARGVEGTMEIISLIRSMREDENRLVGQKSILEKEKTEYTRLAIILGSLLALSFIFIATVIIFKDINKRARIESALLQKEKLFRTVVHNFPDGSISIFDKNLKYLISDGTELRESGYTAQHVEGKYVKDIMPDDLYSTVEPFYHDALSGNKNSIEFKYNDKTYYSIFLPLVINNNIEGGIIITQNITKRKTAEEELKQSEALYRTIAENFPNGSITVFDDDLRIVKTGGLILKEFGLEKEEMEGRLINELVPEDLFSKLKNNYYGVFEGKSSVFNMNFKGKYLMIITVPMLNDKGKIINGMAISQDITSIKEYEEKILQSRDFYLTLFEEFPALIRRSGTDAKFNYFNKTWVDFTGKTGEEELVNGWENDVYPGDLERYLNVYLSAFKGRQPFTIEYRLKRHDGKHRWINGHGRPYYSLEGNFAGYIESCYDITANKIAEEKQERNTQLTTLLQDIAIAANESEDINGLIKFTINRISEFTKWPIGHLFWNMPFKNELVSSKIWSDNIPRRYDEFRKFSEGRIFKENEGIVGKVLTLKKHIWMSDITLDKEFVRVKRIKDLDLITGFSFPIKVKDEIVSVVEFYTDVYHEEDKELLKIMENIAAQLGRAIERKWSNDNLRKSEEALEKAQMIAHIGSWEWNIEENTLSWSDELYRIYGLDPDKDKITFEKFSSIVHPDDINYVLEVIENARKNKLTSQFEHRIIRPEGTERVLFCQCEVTTDENGNVSGMVGTGQDVTEKKIAEDNLRNTNRKLQEAQSELINNEKLAAIGRIASNMAHEIRNPLANISASSQLLLNRYKDDNSLKSYLDIINRNTDTANRIIRELLDFASPREIKLTRGDLNKVIKYVSNLVGPRCVQNNIDLRIDNRLNGNYEILLNEKKLEEALLNFISNSIDAMPGGGKLEIILKYDEYNEDLVLCIEDTGYGIPKENLDKVFEPFFTTKDNGTGLGMGLSHQIIKSHNGKLIINSEVGEGTSIEIKFPVINKSNTNGEANSDN